MPTNEILSTADFLADARQRATAIRTRRQRLRSIAVSVVSAVVGLAVVVGVALVLSRVPLNERGGTGSGAATAIGPTDAGAYVLVGIVCFVAGVVVTLLSVRYAARHQRDPGS